MRASPGGMLITAAGGNEVTTGSTMQYTGLGALYGTHSDTLRNIRDVVVAYGGKSRTFFITGVEEDTGSGTITLFTARGEEIAIRRRVGSGWS